VVVKLVQCAVQAGRVHSTVPVVLAH